MRTAPACWAAGAPAEPRPRPGARSVGRPALLALTPPLSAGQESAVPVPPAAPDPLQPARPVQAVWQRHVGQRVHARRGVHRPPPRARGLPLRGHGLAPAPGKQEGPGGLRRLGLCGRPGPPPRAGACGGGHGGRGRDGHRARATPLAPRRGQFHVNGNSGPEGRGGSPSASLRLPSPQRVAGPEKGKASLSTSSWGGSRRGPPRPGDKLGTPPLGLMLNLSGHSREDLSPKGRNCPLIPGRRGDEWGFEKPGSDTVHAVPPVCRGRCLPPSRSPHPAEESARVPEGAGHLTRGSNQWAG